MKNLKLTLSLLIVLALLSGLFVNGLNQAKETVHQEFLFDTLCSITVYSKKDAKAVDLAYAEAARIHRLADFYSNTSDVSKINNAKSGEVISVDPDIMNMLVLAQEVFEKSGGTFDVSIAPISQLWKFSDENPTPPSDEQLASLLPQVGFEALVLDEKNATVLKKSNNTQIDLGGIAKGYAADKAVQILKNNNVKSALIDFGGNIVTLGENPKTKNKKWRIGLQTPFAPTGEYSKIVETDGGRAVVTSGTYQRYFEYNNTKYHHIIDPKTGKPADKPYASVTTIADNAALADCLATAIFVLGENAGTKLADEFGAEVYFVNPAL